MATTSNPQGVAAAANVSLRCLPAKDNGETSPQDGFLLERVGENRRCAAEASRAAPRRTERSWPLPLPPARFPLRDALMSLDSESIDCDFKAPLVCHHTAKSKDMMRIGHSRRHERPSWKQWSTDDQSPLEGPSPTGPLEQRISELGQSPSLGSKMAKEELKRSEVAAGAEWRDLRSSEPVLAQSDLNAPWVKSTWTSSTRELLAHAPRTGVGASSPRSAGGKSMSERTGMEVKDWMSRGFRFTNYGLGLGERFRGHASRSPGPAVYEQEKIIGNTALWTPKASQPARQPNSKNSSPPVHKIGVRRDVDLFWLQTGENHRPGPGTYETRGFAGELKRKLEMAGRAKGQVLASSPEPGGQPSMRKELRALMR